MKWTRMTRRSLLGGLLTAGAVAAFPEGIAHSESLSTTGETPGPLSAATPGLHYERFSPISFLPSHALPDPSGYWTFQGGLRFGGPGSETFVCPFGPAHGSTLKELEFYIETGTVAGASLFLIRINNDGTFLYGLANAAVSPTSVFQTVTIALDQVVDLINYDYQLWATFHTNGTFRGARVASIAPTGLITVPQNRKLDTRSGAKPVAGSVTAVDLAPDVPKGARAALVTITATGTVNGGFVTAFPGDAVSAPDTSSLNWTASNLDVATTSVVNLGAGTSIKLAIGGSAGTATHILCDVLGYFI
jgi:hypothetical protein